MSKKTVVTIALVALLAMTVVVPVAAVTYGEPDGNGHPFVGLVVFYNSAGKPMWRCTGALLSPTVFLTAGHCTGDPVTPPARAQVWFDSYVSRPPYPDSGGVMGTPIPHPAWNGSLTIPNTHDVGVVILDVAVTDKGYGQLAAAGTLDSLTSHLGLQNVTFKVVGYGLQGIRPEYLSARERYRGWTRVVNLNSALTDGYNIQLSNNPGHWSGGTCFGDSGGPIFLNDTNVIVAVNSFVLNGNCKGAGFGFRVDTEVSRSFLSNYVSLP